MCESVVPFCATTPPNSFTPLPARLGIDREIQIMASLITRSILGQTTVASGCPSLVNLVFTADVSTRSLERMPNLRFRFKKKSEFL